MKIIIKDEDKNQFTESDYILFKVLEEDPFFENYVRFIREKAEISLESIGDQKEISQLPSSKKRIVGEYATTLISAYELNPIYWLAPFISVILSNTLIPPRKSKYPPIEIRNLYSQVQIIVRETYSPEEVINFLKEHRSKLSRNLRNVSKPPKIKIQNIHILKRILELEKEGKPDKEIGEIIEKEFGDETGFMTDYATIQQKRKRFKENIIMITNKKPSLRLAISQIISK